MQAMGDIQNRGQDFSPYNPAILAEMLRGKQNMGMDDAMWEATNFLTPGRADSMSPAARQQSEREQAFNAFRTFLQQREAGQRAASEGQGTATGGGTTSGANDLGGQGLNVGDALTANTQGGLINSSNVPGIPGIPGTGGMSMLNSIMGLFGLPGMAAALFQGVNKGMGFAAGQAVDPSTGLPVNMINSIVNDPLSGTDANAVDFGNMAISPATIFGNMLNTSIGNAPGNTVSPLGGNQAGFATSPFSLGTPFSGNPVDTSNTTNFTSLPDTNVNQSEMDLNAPGQTGSGTGGTPGGAPSGTGGAPAGDSGGPSASGSSPSGGASGEASYRGGYLSGQRTKTKKGHKVHGGEFVMNATATSKYRPILEAMNDLIKPNRSLDKLMDEAGKHLGRD